MPEAAKGEDGMHGASMHGDVIAAIYDAPMAAQPWAELSGRLRRELDCSGTMFTFARADAADGRTRFIFDTAWDARESWRLYDSTYRYLDPTRHRTMALGAVYDFDQMMPPSPDGEAERYLGFCRSIGASHALFTYLGEHRGVRAWLSISRDDARGRFDDGEAAALVALLPHLQRAAAIHARLEAERNSATIHAAALADLGVGVILLDGGGAIISTNRLADRLLDRGTAIARDRDRLKVRGANGAALSRSLAGAGAGAGDGRVIVAGDGAGDPLHLLVRPWRDDEGDGAGAAYIVYVDSPADQAVPRVDALRRRFGFTYAEARMAALLAEGRTLEAAGEAIGLTLASARTYGKRVLARVGATRQADLVRMILTSLARLD